MPPDLTPHLVHVRPGRTAQEWVRGAIAALKSDDPLAPVTLVAPNYYAGRQTRWLLARSGGYVNVRSMLLTDVATQLVSGTAGLEQPLTAVLEESAVRTAIHRFGGVLSPLAHHRSLHRALVQLFRELRRQEVSLNGPLTEMARAAHDTFAIFNQLIEPYADRTRIRERAAEHLTSARAVPRPLMELGAFVAFLPPRLDPVDARFLAALARWTPVRLACAAFGDSEALANALPTHGANLFSQAVQSRTAAVATIHVKSELRQASIAVIRAPDPAEEIREVVRSIARDLEADDPVPLHRVAVLYRLTDPYGPLVRDSLALADLPWSALEGRTLAESRPGRALLAALAIQQRDFAREAVLGWVDAALAEQTDLPGSAWDRLSRAANIVRGSDQWLLRLANYAARQRELAIQREGEDNLPAANALRVEVGLAERMHAMLLSLAQTLSPPRDGSPWGDFVSWAEAIWTRHCGGIAAWTDSKQEQPYAVDVATTLNDLRQADTLEHTSGVSLSLFAQTLQESLEGRARPVGSLGQGVLVGPVQSVTGLAFERVYIVGMTEGAFPTPATADPFFPSAGEDPLGLRERQRSAERQAFRTAVAAADGGKLTLCVPDSLGGRKAFPSPWLLEMAAEPSGRSPLMTAQFQALQEDPTQPWLRVVTSSLNGLRGTPALADLEEIRLRQAASVERLQSEPIAARADLPLGRGLLAIDSRATSDFSAYDGNVGELVASATDLNRLLRTAQTISASGIETWATCPFQFFLGRVLRVNTTERPEDAWSVDPLERGSLVHHILERFFRALTTAGRFDGLTDYSSDDRQLLEDIADTCFVDLEARGVTGHPLVWENTAAAIRADLRTFLIKDERWRRDEGLRPAFFEQPFGSERDPRSWPALALQFAGIDVSFRGYIDRVDLDPGGRRAFLYDYKTGSTTSYNGMSKDPLMAGKHVQLALYRRAVLASIPDLEDGGVDGAFWFVSSRGGFKMLPADEPLHDPDRRLTEVLERTARGILDGVFPQVPGNETARPGKFSWDNCVYCAFDRVCPAGRDAVWERKQFTPGYVLHASLTAGVADGSEE
jgi:ATP-dependent helicase/nuclease subunit B